MEVNHQSRSPHAAPMQCQSELAPFVAGSTPRIGMRRPQDVQRARGLKDALLAACLLSVAALGFGCDRKKTVDVLDLDDTPASEDDSARTITPRSVDTRPAPQLDQPVPVWIEGETRDPVEAAEADASGYLLIDLGEHWTPYLFTERGGPDEEPVPNAYRETYLALARGEFPDDHHGERAREDRFLELYGIPPTLGALKQRFDKVSGLKCFDKLDLEPLKAFEGFLVYTDNRKAHRQADIFRIAKHNVERLLKQYKVAVPSELPEAKLSVRDKRWVQDYERNAVEAQAIFAAQERLICEGYLSRKSRYKPYAFDWETHEGLALFEKRHRVYGWGFLGRDTLTHLKEHPLELERQALVRMLTERAMHAAGVIEDGSTSFVKENEPRTFEGADGREHRIPNLEAEIEARIVNAFGLQTVESTRAFYEKFGDIHDEMLVAVPAPKLPEYYAGDMEITVEIHRGDVWYEFPYDEQGRERSQPVEHRPRLVVFVNYRDQKIPLARYGTTIGGWRTESVEGTVMWKYKDSPVGPRIWTQIVASPVWLPPAGTPAKDMIKRRWGTHPGKEQYYVNYHETGPSYASAYGLVAAYHQKYHERTDGSLRLLGDEGIRTHGSVDYMSIMRRHSHGCHRLHNHIAVRLMSFVLAHRPHRRAGQQSIAYRRDLPFKEFNYVLELKRGGYVFELERPLPINVTEGRIRGRVDKPIVAAIPRYREDLGGYVSPDGRYVKVFPNGRTEEIPPPSTLEALPPEVIAARDKAEAKRLAALEAGEEVSSRPPPIPFGFQGPSAPKSLGATPLGTDSNAATNTGVSASTPQSPAGRPVDGAAPSGPAAVSGSSRGVAGGGADAVPAAPAPKEPSHN